MSCIYSIYNKMKDKYTYEEITAATRLMLSSENRSTIATVAEESGIKEFRIKTWRKRWRQIEQNEVFRQNHLVTLKYISNLTYGVSEAVWNDWLIAIDAALPTIEELTLTNDILTVLQEIARQINAKYPAGKGVTTEMIDRALAYFVDAMRAR